MFPAVHLLSICANPNCGYCREYVGHTRPMFDSQCLPGDVSGPTDPDRSCQAHDNWFYESCTGYVPEDTDAPDIEQSIVRHAEMLGMQMNNGQHRDHRDKTVATDSLLEAQANGKLASHGVLREQMLPGTAGGIGSSSSSSSSMGVSGRMPWDQVDPLHPTRPIQTSPTLCCQICVSEFYKETELLEVGEELKTHIVHRFHAWKVGGGKIAADGSPLIDHRLLPSLLEEEAQQRHQQEQQARRGMPGAVEAVVGAAAMTAAMDPMPPASWAALTDPGLRSRMIPTTPISSCCNLCPTDFLPPAPGLNVDPDGPMGVDKRAWDYDFATGDGTAFEKISFLERGAGPTGLQLPEGWIICIGLSFESIFLIFILVISVGNQGLHHFLRISGQVLILFLVLLRSQVVDRNRERRIKI